MNYNLTFRPINISKIELLEIFIGEIIFYLPIMLTNFVVEHYIYRTFKTFKY